MTTYRPEPAGLDKLSITAKTLVTAAAGDHVLIADLSDSSNLKKVTVQTIVDLASGGGEIPTAITVADEAVDTSCFIMFVTAANGDLGPKTNAGLTYNSATGALSSNRGTTDGEFFGSGSGVSNTTGNYNTGFGNGALAANTTGQYNTAIGWHTLFANTTGDYNVGIGLQALVANTTGIKNTALGMQTLNANTSGSYNVASGYQALVTNTTGSLNNAYGNDALHSNTTGEQNTAVGDATLNFNSTGSNNTGCGQASLYNQTTGSNNTALGLSAGHDITTGSFNVVIGANANPVSLSGNAQLNLGNLVFGTGLYSGSTPSSTAVSGGKIGIGKNNPATTLDVNGAVTSSGLTTTAASSATVAATVKGAASQSVSIQEWQNSAGTVLASVSPAGNLTASGTVTSTANGAASTPASILTGTWFTGGTTTTTKPQLLVEPTGTTSTGWNSNGTGVGVNAASGFAGDFFAGQIAGVSLVRARVFDSGNGQLIASTFSDPADRMEFNCRASPPLLNLNSTGQIRISSTSVAYGTADLSLSRNAAGVWQMGNGTNNALGSLLLTNLTASGTGTLGIYTVATLPSASSNPYAEANVSDALTPAMGSTVANGGSVKTKVRSNGTNWTVSGI